MITPSALIRQFQIPLDEHWGYIYGRCEPWTAAKQAAYEKEYAGDPDRQASCIYGGRWAGRMVTDCARLFSWAFTQLGGSIARGSNSIWDRYLPSRGTLKAGARTDGKPLLPGTAVFTASGGRHNHIGLYVGDRRVIEARGAEYGVVAGKITDSKWTAWGELRGVDYQNSERKGVNHMAKVVLPEGASGATVNMRDEDSRHSALVARVPVGSEVEIKEDCEDWCLIRYDGRIGWMMSDYLEYGGQEGESSGETLPEEERLIIDAALTEIDRHLVIIRSALGKR